MSKIISIKSREILDSRGNPTIETDVITEKGGFGRASIPSGKSTGNREALELRDNDYKRYNGKGVLKAVKNVNKIISKVLLNEEVSNQEKIDKIMIELDGTKNKSKLGANAILSVSLACLKASANENEQELYEYLGNKIKMPYPMMNILNGGAHANNTLDFQEFMIIPQNKDFNERIRCGAEIFHSLKKVLDEKGYSTNLGDEGGLAPDLNSNEEALDYIITAIKEAGYKPNIDVKLALDVAANGFYNSDDNLYYFNKTKMNSEELIKYYEELIKKYPIISIEDPFYEEDFNSLSKLTQKIGSKVQIVGDDYFATNSELLKKGIKSKAANAVLIKLNQVGTVSEALKTIKLAKENGYNTIISHRSGETEDTFIADLAVGLSINQIKAGSLSRIDRIAKYNRLIRINEALNDE